MLYNFLGRETFLKGLSVIYLIIYLESILIICISDVALSAVA